MARLYLKGAYLDTDDNTLHSLNDAGVYEELPIGGGGVTIYTFQEIVAIIGSNGLIVGQQYLISDFRTIHYIVDADGTQYPDSIITGDLEPLLVTAVALNKLNCIAKSTVYDGDIIYYDLNEINWLGDLSFAIDGDTIVPGWKGTIYFRNDTINDNYMGYDFRNCKLRRWAMNVTAWDSGATYNQEDTSKLGGIIYKSVADDNTNNSPSGPPSSFWVRCLDSANTNYYNNSPNGTNGIPSDIADFIDEKTFVENGAATYDVKVKGNHFDRSVLTSEYAPIFSIISNNVFYLNESVDGVLFNTFYQRVNNNTFYGSVKGNNASNNVIGNQTSNNFIDNDLGNTFVANIVFGQFYDNFIDSEFLSCICGSDFHTNRIDSNFTSNWLIGTFTLNDVAPAISGLILNDTVLGKNIMPNIDFGGIDFSEATIIYGNYNATVLKNSNADIKITYLDNSNVFTVANVNA